MKKIIDEYTDRTDLTDQQKYDLRHPGRRSAMQKAHRKAHPEVQRECQRRWRSAHPEQYKAITDRSNRKTTLKRIQSRQLKRVSGIVEKQNPVWRSRRGEVLRMLERGRSIAQIVVGLSIPASVVLKIQAEYQQSTPQTNVETHSTVNHANP